MKKLWLLLLLPVVVGLLVNWLTSIDIPGSAWAIIKWVGSLFVLKFTLPIWAILFLLLILPTLILVTKALLRSHTGNSHKNYLSDTFFEILWFWRYVGGRLYDENFVPRCPNCMYILQPIEESAFQCIDNISLVCHHCGFKKRFDFNMHTLLDRVKREIDLKIVTGKYISDEQH